MFCHYMYSHQFDTTIMLPAVLIFYILSKSLALEIIPQKITVDYVNEKYLTDMKLTLQKRSRHSPYYILLDVKAHYGFGNNISFKMEVYERISGRDILTPIRVEYKLCDFLYKEPLLGKMYAKQIPGNWTCPFPAGEYHYHDFVMYIEKFPFNIPFTWSSLRVQTRVDIEGFLTSTKESLFKWLNYVVMIQKLEK